MRTDLLRIALVCVAACLVRFRMWGALDHPALLGLTATLVGGYPIFKEAFDGLIERRVTMAWPATIALVAALIIRDVLTALVITACVIGAGVMEALAVARGRRAGRRTLDRRAPIQEIADRVAASLVYAAMAAAVVTLVVTRDVRAMIAVIIVAGARGVTAGTPLAMLGTIGRAARSGAMIKGGVHLETLWSINTVVLDQTGAVTFGDVRVTTVYPVTGVSVREVLEAAVIAECRSEHPIGRAIIRYAAEKRIPQREPGGFTDTPGEGVYALDGVEEILVGNSGFVTAGRLPERPADGSGSKTVFVVRGGRYLGSVAVANMPHPDTKRAIADLKALAVKTYLFSGDSGAGTERLARDLSVDDFETGLTPDAKLARVRLLAKTRRVAMVGKDLLTFVDTLRLARRTHAIILQNVVGTVIVDGVGIALAATGVVTPIMAAAIHVTAALAFILNSARLVPPR